MIYVDTSVLVAYYCPEPLSHQAEEIVRGHPRPAISQLVEVELFSAVARKVREGQLNAQNGRRVFDVFATHLDGGFYTRLPLDAGAFRQARDWIARLDEPLRTLDALHLACASARGLRFVTADRRLSEVCGAFGVEVEFVTSSM